VKIKIFAGIAACAGLLGTILLIGYYGFGAVVGALLGLGWGLVWVSLFHIVPMICSALGWWALQNATSPGPPLLYIWVRWIRESANALLPVAQVGGELIGARILTIHGAKGSVAVAGSLVDMTMEVITQFLFTLLGIALLVALRGYDSTTGWLVVGAGVAALALGGFVLAQRRGLFMLLERGLEYLARKTGWSALGRANGLHDAVVALHEDPRGLAISCIFHSLSWVVGAGEIWLALYFMGHPVGVIEALIIESLGQAVRSAAFAVPGALGAQEGGYLLVGGLLGLSPELALALSLVKRVRDLLLGVPGLLAWQLSEGRVLISLARRAGKRPAER